MEFYVIHGLLLQIGQLNSAAEFLEGERARLGFQLGLDGEVNSVRQLRVVRRFGQDPLEQVQQLCFIRPF